MPISCGMRGDGVSIVLFGSLGGYAASLPKRTLVFFLLFPQALHLPRRRKKKFSMKKTLLGVLAIFVTTVLTTSVFAGFYTPSPLLNEFPGGGFIPVKEKHFKAELTLLNAIAALSQEILQRDQKAVKNIFQGQPDGIESCVLKGITRYLAVAEKVAAKTLLLACLEAEQGIYALMLLPTLNQAVFCEPGPSL